MHSAVPFHFKVNERQCIHVIVGTPDSNRRSTLAHAVRPNMIKHPSSHFLFPHELEMHRTPGVIGNGIEHGFKIEKPGRREY